MFRRQDRIAIYCSMILRHTSYDIQYTKNYSYARRFYEQSSKSKSKSKSLYSPSNVKHYTWGYDRIMESSKAVLHIYI